MEEYYILGLIIVEERPFNHPSQNSVRSCLADAVCLEGKPYPILQPKKDLGCD